MNQFLYRRLFLLLCMVVPLLGLAQPKLRFASFGSAPHDTVVYPNTGWITYTAIVENAGTNQLTGPCSIQFRYNSDTLTHTLHQWSVSNFEVGQMDTVVFNDPIGPLGTGRYDGGVNIIVIWPQSDNPGTQAPDTTFFPIFIQNITGTSDPKAFAQRVELYPNPVGEEFHLRYLQGDHKVEYVRILNSIGQTVYESERAVEHVGTDSLPQGTYYVLIKFKDGMIGSIPIVKPD